MEDVDTFIIVAIHVCIGKCDSLWLYYMALKVPSLCWTANKGDHLLRWIYLSLKPLSDHSLNWILSGKQHSVFFWLWVPYL